MLSVTKVLTHDRLCRAMTGLTPREFRDLAPTFTQELRRRAMEAYRTNPHRQRAPGGGRKLFVPTPEEQLFFLLTYYKTYPTFDVLGFLYDWPDIIPQLVYYTYAKKHPYHGQAEKREIHTFRQGYCRHLKEGRVYNERNPV